MSLFVKKTLERMGKTFVQFYLFAWMVKAGIVNIGAGVPDSSSYDVLFTANNAKAGVVGVAMSLATSLGSKSVGPDNNSPSVV